ncbi:hypothetical protein LXL04_015498 [Taraxacum kok-saghyz]
MGKGRHLAYEVKSGVDFDMKIDIPVKLLYPFGFFEGDNPKPQIGILVGKTMVNSSSDAQIGDLNTKQGCTWTELVVAADLAVMVEFWTGSSFILAFRFGFPICKSRRMDQKGASKNFMAFGGGMRFCVGTDFTKVQMAVFLHCLVTKYGWQMVRGGEIVRIPGLQFPKGFHVEFTEKGKQNQDSETNP